MTTSRIDLNVYRRGAGLLLALALVCWAGSSPAATPDAAALDDLCKKIAKYEAGQDVEAMTAAVDAVVAAFDDPAGRTAIAQRLALVLESDATLAGKQFVCKQLYLIGGEEVIPVLSKLLCPDTTQMARFAVKHDFDEPLSDMARYALEHMPSDKANTALLEALQKTSGAVRVGIINSLGERRDPVSASKIAELVNDKDAGTVEAAVRALAKIGGPAAFKGIARVAWHAPSPTLQTVAQDAYLKCADELLANGKTGKAAAAATLAEAAEWLLAIGKTGKATAIYAKLYRPEAPTAVCQAALVGLVRARDEKGVYLVEAALKNESPALQAAAAIAARSVSGAQSTESLAALLSTLSASAQAVLIPALADRGDKAALAAVCDAARNSDAAVRQAALTALKTLGDASSVGLLAQVAAGADPADAETARMSLDRLRGGDINSAMVNLLASSAPTVQVELARSLGARAAYESVPALTKTAGAGDEAVRAEAFTALGILAKADQLTTLITLACDVASDKVRAEAENALVAVAKKIPAESGPAASIVAALPTVQDKPAARASLLRVLGRVGDDGALEAIRAAVRDKDATVQGAAVEALAGWPSDAVLPDLEGLARTSKDESFRGKALGGYLRILALPSDRDASKTLAKYEVALRLAKDDSEKKLALAGLASVRDPRTVSVVTAYLKNPALKAEAEAALDKLAKVSYLVTASQSVNEAALAVDGKLDTRWATGEPQKPGQWFQIDLGWEKKVSKVVIDDTPSPGDFPRGYEVYVSKNTSDWGKPVATGQGAGPITSIAFAAKTGRYIKIVQTGKADGLWWSIHELTVSSR